MKLIINMNIVIIIFILLIKMEQVITPRGCPYDIYMYGLMKEFNENKEKYGADDWNKIEIEKKK